MSWIDYKNTYDRVPQSWIIDSQDIQNIIEFIKNTMKNWRMELNARGRNLAEVKIQRRIFLGDVLLPLLFVIGMMLLNHILGNAQVETNFINHQKKINHQMDDIKMFAKDEKYWKT